MQPSYVKTHNMLMNFRGARCTLNDMSLYILAGHNMLEAGWKIKWKLNP